MAVTLKEISEWLNSDDTKHDLNTEKERITFGFGDEENKQSVWIRTKDEGKSFELQMQLLDDDLDNIEIKDHEHAGLVLQHILYINYNTKFGTWEYDPSDGDIRMAVEIPLEDAVMTQAQFQRIMDHVYNGGAKYAKEIKQILATGELPESDDDPEELFKQLMLKMIQDKLKDLESKKDEEGI